jgi:5-methylthioadenosine/S-adenosylhomocysteine deaminase
MRNLVPNLVYAARGDEVETVVVDGQIVVDKGRVMTMLEDEILDDAQRLATEVGPAANQDFWRLDTPNARAMREGNL